MADHATFVARRSVCSSIKEPFAQRYRDDGAHVVSAAKNSVARASNKIIDRVAEAAWHDGTDGGECAPGATEAAENVNECVGTDKQAAIGCK